MIDSDNIRLISSSVNTTHPPSINVDINVLQLPNSDNIILITKIQLIDSQQQDTSIKPVYQFVQLNIKFSKKEWDSLSYCSRVLLKQFGKINIHDILVHDTKKYSQIVLYTILYCIQ